MVLNKRIPKRKKPIASSFVNLDRVAIAIAAADMHESRESVEYQFGDHNYHKRCDHYRSLAEATLQELTDIRKEAMVKKLRELTND